MNDPTQSASKSRRPWLLFAAKLGLSVLLVAWVVRRVNFIDILARIHEADRTWLVLALTSSASSVLFQALRWKILTFGHLSWRQSVAYTWIGLFYGAVLPGGVSGDIAKGTAMAVKHESTRTALLPLSIAADRLAGLYALSFLFSLSAVAVLFGATPQSTGLQHAAHLGLAASVAYLVAAPLLLSAACRGLVQRLVAAASYAPATRLAARLTEVIEPYAARPGIWLRVLPLSLLNHGVNIVTNALLLLSLGATLDWSEWIVFYSMISALLMMPVSISGLGVRDWFALFFFPAAGVSAELGVAYSWLSLGLGLTTALAGGGVQLFEIFRPGPVAESSRLPGRKPPTHNSPA